MLALTVQLHTETKAGHMRKNDRLFAGKYGLVGLHWRGKHVANHLPAITDGSKRPWAYG